MADIGSNACKLVMDADNSGDGSCILNTSTLRRELQECLPETIIMMESHVGDSYTGKEFDNEKDEGKNNSSGIVRDDGASDGDEKPVVDDRDGYVILEGFK